eukprot:2350336-Amphidinium_carterae.2
MAGFRQLMHWPDSCPVGSALLESVVQALVGFFCQNFHQLCHGAALASGTDLRPSTRVMCSEQKHAVVAAALTEKRGKTAGSVAKAMDTR